MKKQNLYCTILFSVFFASAQAQLSPERAKLIETLKNDTTFVPMKYPEADLSKEYLEVIKKYWTFPSTIVAIKYSDVERHAQPGNSFLAIEGWGGLNEQYFTDAPLKTTESATDLTAPPVGLDLWTVDAAELEKNGKKAKKDPHYWTDAKKTAAFTALSSDLATVRDKNNIYQAPYDCDGHVFNWGKGYLKNHIQEICRNLEGKFRGESKKPKEPFFKADEIGKLKYQTLYIPDYMVNHRVHSSLKGTYDDEREDPAKLFKEYPFKYKIISDKEMNEKIETESIYYLRFTRDLFSHRIYIVNSVTGEEIFYGGGSDANPQAKDFKILSEKISE